MPYKDRGRQRAAQRDWDKAHRPQRLIEFLRRKDAQRRARSERLAAGGDEATLQALEYEASLGAGNPEQDRAILARIRRS